MEESENTSLELIPEQKYDKLDLYREFLLGKKGIELTEKQEKMFEYYLLADKLLCTGAGKKGGLSYQNTVSVVASHFKVSRSNAFKIVRESQELFGDTLESMKKAQKRVAYENFIRIANKAEEMGNFEAAISARDKAAKLYGLYEEEAGITQEKVMQLLQINTVFSGNINVLNKGKEAND